MDLRSTDNWSNGVIRSDLKSFWRLSFNAVRPGGSGCCPTYFMGAGAHVDNLNDIIRGYNGHTNTALSGLQLSRRSPPDIIVPWVSRVLAIEIAVA